MHPDNEESEQIPSGTVFVVDDDEAVRDSVALLMRSVGLPAQTFKDARSFLDDYDPAQIGCLVLDVRMPRMSGLDLQRELKRRDWRLPVIFITGHGDVPMAVEAMRAGAVEFLQKPFNDDELIRRVNRALAIDASQRKLLHEVAELRQRYETLTVREREIAQRLASGAANKVLAIDLNLSERTVEVHRAHILEKMKARGVAQLAQQMLRLELKAKVIGDC
ncbi:MAG: response regulator transcription factor [Gammaproteobacteria bacterium]|nr:response regulator transcription factor [Gammaproteobacteria bacterium]